MKTYPVTINFPEQALQDILFTACESGSNYWLCDYKGVRATRTEGAGEYTGLVIGQPRPGSEAEGTPPVHTRITLERIAAAIGELVSGQHCAGTYLGQIFGETEFRANMTERGGCSADATACDCVLQVAVFGEVIYG
jgi:hypothetical protein